MAEKLTSVDLEVPILYSGVRETVYLNGEERKTATIRVTGTYSVIDALNPSWFSASVALENYIQGTFRLPIRVLFDGDAAAYQYELIGPEDGFVDVVLEEIVIPEPEPPEEQGTVEEPNE